MKADEIHKLVARLDFKRFTIRACTLGVHDHRVLVDLHTLEINMRRQWVISRDADLWNAESEEEALKLIREAIINAVVHEVDEALFFDDKQLTPPHPEGQYKIERIA